MLGLLTTWPALRLLFNAVIISSRSGGHAQGILIGWPLMPLTAPSQSPAEARLSSKQGVDEVDYALPVGLRPLENPVSGTRLGSTSRLTGSAETVEMRKAVRTVADVMNFMSSKEWVSYRFLDSLRLPNERIRVGRIKYERA